MVDWNLELEVWSVASAMLYILNQELQLEIWRKLLWVIDKNWWKMAATVIHSRIVWVEAQVQVLSPESDFLEVDPATKKFQLKIAAWLNSYL